MARIWTEIRITISPKAIDELLLSVVAPWLNAHRQVGVHAFFVRERRGTTRTLTLWTDASSPSSVTSFTRDLRGRLGDEGTLQVNQSSELSFASGTYTGPMVSALLGGLLSEATPLMLDQLTAINGDRSRRNEAALEMMVSHLAAADFHAAWPDRYAAVHGQGTSWPRMFVSYRSHADGFVIMTKNPEATRLELNRRYDALGERLSGRIRQLLTTRIPDSNDTSPRARWYRIAHRYLLDAETALSIGSLSIRLDDGYLGDHHDLSASAFQKALQENHELRRFQRTDAGFQAMRFTTSALYLVLSNLGLGLMERCFLCHAISRTCEELYAIDPTALILSYVPRPCTGHPQ